MIVTFALTMGQRRLEACPFCSPFVGMSLLMELDVAETVVLATLVRSPQSSDDRMAEFFVVDVLKGGGDLNRWAPLEARMVGTNEVGTRFLLLKKPGQKSSWSHRSVETEVCEFAYGAAKLPQITETSKDAERVRRLAYCLPYLASPNEQLALCAYGEFSAAPYSAVKQLSPELDGDQLKSWIKSTRKDDSTLRGLLFMLLGVCGEDDDEAFLQRAFEEGLANARSTELAAIIAAWIKVEGTEALATIDHRLLKPNDVESTRRRAAVEALRFHANVDKSVIDKSRIVASARLLLAHPQAADFIIRDLAEWKDWGALETILSLWNKHGESSTWLKSPITEYLKACPNEDSEQVLADITRK